VGVVVRLGQIFFFSKILPHFVLTTAQQHLTGLLPHGIALRFSFALHLTRCIPHFSFALISSVALRFSFASLLFFTLIRLWHNLTSSIASLTLQAYSFL
jgi:hypothetical protein